MYFSLDPFKGIWSAIRFILGVLFLFSMISAQAQLTFKIENLPENTPKKDTLFLAGTLNKWHASNDRYQFHKNADGYYYTDAIEPNQSGRLVSFLVTRGSWETVESEIGGLPRITRRISYNPSRMDTISLKVETWADKEKGTAKIPLIKVSLMDIPKNTPPDAPIYIAGNFNGWIPGDTRYLFEKDVNGIYTVEIPAYWPVLEYKFTRGNWSTVEGSAYGRPRADRIIKWKEIPFKEPVFCTITHWEDQSSGMFNPYTLILMLTAIQGILLLIIVNTYENTNKRANRILSVLIFLISFALLTSVAIYDREIYNAYPKISLLPDFIYFLYAPLFSLYIHRLLKISGIAKKRVWMYFIPFCLHLVLLVIFFFEPIHLFIGRSLSPLYSSPWYIVIGGMALVFNGWFWFKIRNTVRLYLKNAEAVQSDDPHIRYLNKILTLKAICLILWLITYLIGAMGLTIDRDLTSVTDFLVDAIWAVFSFTVYLLGYFAIKQPAIFKIEKMTDEVIQKPDLNQKEIQELKSTLENAMTTDKLYLEPTLNLPELAIALNSNVHELSRVINEGYHKNFRDFVNSYRIAHFIEKINALEDKNKTYLAIALESGFNSKSSFNRSFKKIKGISPREFFQNT